MLDGLRKSTGARLVLGELRPENHVVETVEVGAAAVLAVDCDGAHEERTLLQSGRSA
jgi:hypothetical protein